MKLIHGSVNRPVGVTIVVLVVLMIGFVSLTGLGVELIPDLEFPIAAVITPYPGAAPQEVENLVTRPLEGSLSAVQGLENMQSISANNQSVLLLFFDFGTNLDASMLDLRDRVDMVRMGLPDGAGDPSVIRFDPNQMPIMQLGIYGELDVIRLSNLAEESILPRLESIPGVAQVTLIGGQEREISVLPNLSLIQDYGLSLSQISQIIGGHNRSVPAGEIQHDSQRLPLRIIGEFESLDHIRDINIPLQSGEIIKLSEIAEVVDGLAGMDSFAFLNGEPSLSIDVMKETDANTVDVSNAVNREIERMELELTQEISITPIMDSALFIREAIRNVVMNMLIGAAMAIMILLLFLRSIRSTLIIGISIPIALISAFTLLDFAGETLNILTLGGFALGIGLLVDSSIVILENIYKYREKGYSRIEAAKQGASEVGKPVIAATLTSVVVFVPIIFIGGIAAEIFMPLALTVGFILFASLFVAITLVPMLSRFLLPDVSHMANPRGLQRLSAIIGNGIERLTIRYSQALKWSINHKKTIVLGTLILLVACLGIIPLVGLELIPAFDQGEIIASFETPPGTALDEVRGSLSLLEDFLLDTGTTEIVYTSIGSAGVGGPGGMESSSIDGGDIYVRLLPASDRDSSTDDVIDQINEFAEGISNLELNVFAFESGGIGGNPIDVEVRGSDYTILKEIADDLQDIISEVPGASNITHSMADTQPEMQIHVDLDGAIEYGLSYAQVMQTITSSVNGQVATLLRTDGQEIDVKVILPAEYRTDLIQLENLPIMTAMGERIILTDIVEFTEAEGPNVITRQNQTRGVSITGDIMGRELANVNADIEEELSQYSLPEGYDYHSGGEFETLTETFIDLALALMLAIFLVYAVMAFQFEKVMYPFIVMFSLPTTFIGIMLGFLLTGRPLSAPAFIGVIMLAGIVVNNAIVLVDYINTLRSRGLSREEAILEGGASRLRPILMTMLTTVFAMIPLAIGFGEGAELQAPMATVIVFGLSFSTIITLVLVPVMYIYLDSLTDWWKGLFTRKKIEEA